MIKRWRLLNLSLILIGIFLINNLLWTFFQRWTTESFLCYVHLLKALKLLVFDLIYVIVLSRLHVPMLLVFLHELLILRIRFIILFLHFIFFLDVLLLKFLILIPLTWLTLFAFLVQVFILHRFIHFKFFGLSFLRFFVEVLILKFLVHIIILLLQWVAQSLLL